MTINNNKENLRRESNHMPQSAIDKGALLMMCRKDKELRPNVVAY
jgi:hypothetical protein